VCRTFTDGFSPASCKSDVVVFDVGVSCVSNSSFITNCGACQQCIITYAIEENFIDASESLEGVMQEVLNLCLNTTVSSDIIALQSQASRLSLVGDYFTSMTATASSSSHTITPAPTLAANHTAYDISTITSAPVAPTPAPSSLQSTATSQPINKSWIVGPVIGSLLGIATVAVVIYFTRRKHLRDPNVMPVEKNANDIEDDDSGDSTQGKPQLHSESVAPKELESNEVYELAAVEPVGSELNTPRDAKMAPIEEWPLPITPLRAMFAMSEIRDVRAGNNNSPKHETYYHS
jgi:hypothetical protein